MCIECDVWFGTKFCVVQLNVSSDFPRTWIIIRHKVSDSLAWVENTRRLEEDYKTSGFSKQHDIIAVMPLLMNRLNTHTVRLSSLPILINYVNHNAAITTPPAAIPKKRLMTPVGAAPPVDPDVLPVPVPVPLVVVPALPALVFVAVAETPEADEDPVAVTLAEVLPVFVAPVALPVIAPTPWFPLAV